jgi:hypothetical protein
MLFPDDKDLLSMERSKVGLVLTIFVCSSVPPVLEAVRRIVCTGCSCCQDQRHHMLMTCQNTKLRVSRHQDNQKLATYKYVKLVRFESAGGRTSVKLLPHIVLHPAYFRFSEQVVNIKSTLVDPARSNVAARRRNSELFIRRSVRWRKGH